MHVMNDSSKLNPAGKKELKLTSNTYSPEFKAKVVKDSTENGNCQAPNSLAVSVHQRDSYIGNVTYSQLLHESRS